MARRSFSPVGYWLGSRRSIELKRELNFSVMSLSVLGHLLNQSSWFVISSGLDPNQNVKTSFKSILLRSQKLNYKHFIFSNICEHEFYYNMLVFLLHHKTKLLQHNMKFTNIYANINKSKILNFINQKIMFYVNCEEWHGNSGKT